jgi:acyl carrier protein
VGARVITDAGICQLVAQASATRGRRAAVTPDMSLKSDLAIDSIGMITMVYLLEEELRVDLGKVSFQFASAKLVSDVIDIVKTCAREQH